jgi:hypothetical protein
VTVQFDDFKNVANPGHWNETTPCLVQHDVGGGEHKTRGVQPDREWRSELMQRARGRVRRRHYGPALARVKHFSAFILNRGKMLHGGPN